MYTVRETPINGSVFKILDFSTVSAPAHVAMSDQLLSEYIPIYVQQDATLHSLFYLETALHIWGGTTTRNM
jgi:hypothetical protein